MSEANVLVLIGQIGAGKSTVSRKLESVGVRHLDVENMRDADRERMGSSTIADNVASAATSGPVVFECSGASSEFEEIIERLTLGGFRSLVVLLECSIPTALRRVNCRDGRRRPRAGGSWVSQMRWTESRLRLVPTDLTLSSETDDPESIAAVIAKARGGASSYVKDQRVSTVRQEVSFTQLAAFQVCPWSYKLKYVDHLPEIVETEQMFLGGRLHETLAWLYGGSAAQPSKTELVAWFRNRLAETIPSEADGAAVSRLFKAGEKALIFHHEVVYRQERSNTIAIERMVRLPLDRKLTFVGRVDRVAVDASGAIEVIDYKGSDRKRTSRPRIPDWLQLAAYSVAILKELNQSTVIARRVMLATGEEERFAVSARDARRVILALRRWASGMLTKRTYWTRPGPHCASCQFNPICGAAARGAKSRAFIRTVEGGTVVNGYQGYPSVSC
ncbi:MAG: hypothetical protein F4X40_06180 [Chloroflexi bacterium]|nr:hypothetical protein [Chloroflexota bacterium]